MVGTAKFVAKAEEPLLQIADVCAFTIRRWLEKKDYGDVLMGDMLRSVPNIEEFDDVVSFGIWSFRACPTPLKFF